MRSEDISLGLEKVLPVPSEGFLGGEVLFGEADLLALAGEEEVFEFAIREERFDLGTEEEAVVVVE